MKCKMKCTWKSEGGDVGTEEEDSGEVDAEEEENEGDAVDEEEEEEVCA